jgi:hypothetical protein
VDREAGAGGHGTRTGSTQPERAKPEGASGRDAMDVGNGDTGTSHVCGVG